MIVTPQDSEDTSGIPGQFGYVYSTTCATRRPNEFRTAPTRKCPCQVVSDSDLRLLQMSLNTPLAANLKRCLESEVAKVAPRRRASTTIDGLISVHRGPFDHRVHHGDGRELAFGNGHCFRGLLVPT